MPTSILLSLIENLLSKTWYEWIDEILQYIVTELPLFISECAQRVSILLADTISI